MDELGSADVQDWCLSISKNYTNKISGLYKDNFLYVFNHHTAGNVCLNNDALFCKNVSGEVNLGNFFSLQLPFPYVASTPLPVLKPAVMSSYAMRGMDPARNFLWKKSVIKTRIQKIKLHTRRPMQRGMSSIDILEEKLKQAGHFLRVPGPVCSLAKALEEDPDPFFDSNYNWYYTGGTLASLMVADRPVVFKSHGEGFDSLYAIPLKASKKYPSSFKYKDSQCAIASIKNKTLLQLSAAQHSDKGVVGVREKHGCTIFACGQDEEGSLTLLQLYHTNSEKPFTSIAMSPWLSHQYCTSSVDRKVLIWDLQRKSGKEITHLPEIDEVKKQWCGVYFSYQDPNSILFCDHGSVHSIDLRNPEMKTLVLCPKNTDGLLESCESLTLSACSLSSSHLLYVASTHQLMSVDVRRPGVALQRWTHQLKAPPQFLTLCQDLQGKEMVCLASMDASELVGLVNEWIDDKREKFPVCRSAPLALPTRYHTQKQANLLGLCLDSSMQHRFRHSNTGLCFVPSTELSLFSCSSVGDLYCQKLVPISTEPDKGEALNKLVKSMTMWQENTRALERVAVPDLYYSGMTKMKHVLEVMRDKSSEPTLPTPIVPEAPSPAWHLTMEKLFSDRMLSKVLEAWGVPDAMSWEKEEKEAFGKSSSKSKALYSTKKSFEKVKHWLTSDFSFGDQIMPSPIPLRLDKQVDVGLVGVKRDQTVALENEDDGEVLFVTQKPLSKYTKCSKRIRRMDGF